MTGAAPATVSGERLSIMRHWESPVLGRPDSRDDPRARRPASTHTRPPAGCPGGALAMPLRALCRADVRARPTAAFAINIDWGRPCPQSYCHVARCHPRLPADRPAPRTEDCARKSLVRQIRRPGACSMPARLRAARLGAPARARRHTSSRPTIFRSTTTCSIPAAMVGADPRDLRLDRRRRFRSRPISPWRAAL